MNTPDLNLLLTLDILLSEGSVARAARRLGLSPSAMSRALQRLRDCTGDPLLVRSGRNLVPTPRAEELREQVGGLVQQALQLLSPSPALDPARVDRTFTLLCSDGFVENFGPSLLTRIGREAPGIRLSFLPKTRRDSSYLRDGSVDLETGVIGKGTAQELHARALFRDHFVAVVRQGHPLLAGDITLARYAGCGHVADSRHGIGSDPIDVALGALNMQRQIVTSVAGFAAALALARHTELVATVPERHTRYLRTDMATFPLPVAVAEITLSMLWHPRLDADPAHQWLRNVVREVCME
ncbi:LysR family transcriptional regulator [Vogesella sp. LIG4]|uniref:LysR family transcriptional regulator n=1 Tax=Vogesella sp. LIG4 TaxID=1192162 RepID=UPI00081F89DC|nr:LysR family transcriptional regulator [Vogesella sp. LIG4]SCK28291.1 DNA-binding transcriptional regulator, LysR family [Vogesella sp. LIG4]